MLIYNLKNWPATTIFNSVYHVRKKFYNSKKNNLIFLAAYPRSASNYISYLISETAGYERRKLSSGSGFFHETIYLPKLIDSLTEKAVITQHIRANSEFRSILQELDLKITILVRNIFDVIISYNDFISKHERGWSPIDPDRGGNFPEFCKDYFDFEDSRKYDYIIEMVVPWYISFYASWYNYTNIYKKIEGIWVTYEDFFSAQPSSFNKICDFYNLQINREKLNQIIDSKIKINFNKGYSGRGNLLTNSQKDRVKHYTSFFPSVDFSLIGL